MHLTDAPLHSAVAGGPPGGVAYWAQTPDDLRIRLGSWPASDPKGTVLILPGRAEYIEKYGPTAAAFAARGYASLAIDWRGQGLSERLLDDRRIGHVGKFTDYQLDAQTMLAAAIALDLPQPYVLLAHSMGGCIGLRTAIEGADLRAVVFSAPMWGIRLNFVKRLLAWKVTHASGWLGLDHKVPPTARAEAYVLAQPFEDNLLTTDAQMYAFMVSQLRTHPDLALGGPSMGWLREALRECRSLAGQPAPDIPALTVVGTRERIVDMARIQSRMDGWPGGELDLIPGAEHEVLMETPDVRSHIYDRAAGFFDRSCRNET